jgi:predicted dehydrogenase
MNFDTDTQIISVGLIGFGAWGSRIAEKIFSQFPFTISRIATKTERNLVSNDIYPVHTTNYMDIILDESIDLVYAAVHPEVQKNVVPACIYHDRNLIVEKPLFDNLEDLEETKKLIRRWPHNNLFLVNYIHLFNQTFLDWVDYVVSTGKNGIFNISVRGPVKRENMSAKLDYGSHGVSIALYIADKLGVSDQLEWKNREGHIGSFCKGFSFVVRYENMDEKDVSVTFIDYLGETLTWRDENQKFDSLGNLLKVAAQNINTKYSNFDLAYRVGKILLS